MFYKLLAFAAVAAAQWEDLNELEDAKPKCPCKAAVEKKCADSKAPKKCMMKGMKKCKKIKKMMKNPCVQKMAKACKGSDAPKKCFWQKVKFCKKGDKKHQKKEEKTEDEDELVSLEGEIKEKMEKLGEKMKEGMEKFGDKIQHGADKMKKEGFCPFMAKKKCAKDDHPKICMKMKEAKCKVMVKNPCVRKVAKACKKGDDKKAMRKCFFGNVKKCNKEKSLEELQAEDEESDDSSDSDSSDSDSDSSDSSDSDDDMTMLKGGDGKRAAICKKKVAGWCKKDDMKCMKTKFAWCMKQKKDVLEFIL